MLSYRAWFFGAACVVLVGLTGCFGVGPGGGGGVADERKISGTFKSDTGKVIVFNENGSYLIYLKFDEYQARKDPLSEAEYTIIGQEIIFKNDEGTEINDRGILSEDDKTLTWQRYPGETFTQEAAPTP